MDDKPALTSKPAPMIPRKKADYAYDQLRESILDGRYPPGRRMMLAELSGELGLSHMPIREALLRLESEGLLISEPHKGMRVSELSIDDVADLFEVRSALEGLAVHKAGLSGDVTLAADLTAINDSFADAYRNGDFTAMGTANSLFHKRILQAAGNAQLTRLLNDIWLSSASHRMGYRLIEGHAEQAIAEHREIIAALARADADGARAVLQRHIERGGASLTAVLERKEAGEQ